MAQFTNQATLLYNGVSTLSNITTGQIVEALTLTKTPLRDNYAAGDSVVYAVNIVNTSDTDYAGLTLTDNMGAYPAGGDTYYPLSYVEGSILYYVNGEAQAEPTVTVGDTLTVTPLHVPAGGSAMLIYEAEVNQYAPLDSGASITNQASLTGGGITQSVEDSATISAQDQVELRIVKSMYPTVVTENGQLTYTFVIQNSGNIPLEPDGAVVTDTFEPILNDISVTYNGQAWTEGTQYTYDETTGHFATLPGFIQAPAAAFSQNRATGLWNAEPGTCTLVVSGTI